MVKVSIPTLRDADEYVAMAHEAEGEQRGEFGMGAVSMGFDPYDAMGAYDGYRADEDPGYRTARVIIAIATGASRLTPPPPPFDNEDNIPF